MNEAGEQVVVIHAFHLVLSIEGTQIIINF